MKNGENDETTVRKMRAEDVDIVTDIYIEVLTPEYISFTELADGTAESPERVSERAPSIFRAQLLAKLQSSKHALFIAIVDHAVGFAVAELRHTEEGHTECWLEDLGVLHQWRQHGIGRQLVRQVLEWGMHHQTKYFLLESGVDNEAAHRLFAHLGFRSLSKVFWRGPQS